MKKMTVALVVLVLLAGLSLNGCASCSRELKTWKSDILGGLDRVLTVYNYDGTVHARYEGKIDIQSSEGGKVLFDFEGKRYTYYNYPTEVIEK